MLHHLVALMGPWGIAKQELDCMSSVVTQRVTPRDGDTILGYVHDTRNKEPQAKATHNVSWDHALDFPCQNQANSPPFSPICEFPSSIVKISGLSSNCRRAAKILNKVSSYWIEWTGPEFAALAPG